MLYGILTNMSKKLYEQKRISLNKWYMLYHRIYEYLYITYVWLYIAVILEGCGFALI